MAKLSELEIIINKYFQKLQNIQVYYELDQKLFYKVIDLKNTKIYEKPDILSIFDNTIVGIEHFRFDSYKNNSKGSDLQIKQKKVLNYLHEQIEKSLVDNPNVTIERQIKSTSSLDNYIHNFKKTFIQHYKKVDDYINHIREDCADNKKISICFFAEDCTALGNYFLVRKGLLNTPYPLNPLYSAEIIELLKSSPKVKYLILGYYSFDDYHLTIIENKTGVFNKFTSEHPTIKEKDFLSFTPNTVAIGKIVSN